MLKDNVVRIQSGFGEQRTIALLDGSEVRLNSNSELSYNEDNWEQERTLTLKGEAYFKVETGSTFTVQTDNGTVTVLGTEFNVSSVNDYFQVVCYEGKVKVTNADGDHILLPTDNIRKINGNTVETWETKRLEPTWIHGESTFRSVPVKYVISALEDQYNIDFDTQDIDDTIIFTGSFVHNNLNVALKTVFDALQITYIEKEKRTIKLSTN